MTTDTIILAGVSGGADSMCMLHRLKKARAESSSGLYAVHVNHSLRGDSADSDARFVSEICREWNIPLNIIRVDVDSLAKNEGLSTEEAARILRYRAFKEEAARVSAENGGAQVVLAVAHNLNDNAETVLLNLTRGTGVSGLKGMLPESEKDGLRIIRPLLDMSRAEIEEYLEQQGIPHVEDMTNADESYSRNRIRHTVMPALCSINSKAAENINRAAKLSSAVWDLLGRLCDDAAVHTLRQEQGIYYLNIAALENTDSVIRELLVRRVMGLSLGNLKDITAAHTEAVLSLMHSQSGKTAVLPKGLIAERSYDDIIIRSTADDSHDMEFQEQSISKELLMRQGQARLTCSAGELLLKTETVTDENRQRLIQKNQYTKAFDYDKINDTLILGRASSSDEIGIKGGSKKLSRFFIDEKIPAKDRWQTPVLRDQGSVIWIIGQRIGEPCKITDETATAVIARWRSFDE